MLDFTAVAEFSRHHCVAICAFLVPANLILTSLTLACVVQIRSVIPVSLASGLASIFALSLFLHVSTWLLVGVVMIPTFVLLSLGAICLFINLWAALRREQLQKYLRFGWYFLVGLVGRSHSFYRPLGKAGDR
jgi:hypothetical protein